MTSSLRTIRKLCFCAICAASLMICFDAVSKYILTDFETAKKNHDNKEFTRAFRVFAKLARQGDKRAQYYVGRMNHLGEGMPQNKQEAFRWYRMSADQGFDRAENNLGVLLLEQGNTSEAIAMFERALGHGLVVARKNLEAARQQEQLVNLGGQARQSELPRQRQNLNDPSMEFSYHRLREGLAAPGSMPGGR